MGILCGSVSYADSGLIKVTANSGAVDINDIINISSNNISDSDIKRICADITDRYHKKGYSAFYIKRAVRNEDGSVELIFNESVVADVIVSGISSRSDFVSASIFTKGELFNEYTLKEKVYDTKRKFNIRKLNVTVKRADNGDVIILAHAEEKIHEFETVISGSPVYGVLPGVTYRINYGGFLAGISAASSFNQTGRSFSRGSVFFNSDNIPGNSYFTVSADVSGTDDSFDDEGYLIYDHKSVTPAGGFCYVRGAADIKFLITGTIDKLEEYPLENGGVSFSGIQIKFNYNNSLYKIDYDDVTSFGIDFSSGWNFIEERPSAKLALNYNINFPLYSRLFYSLNGSFFYTSDNERFSHFYVYDQFFPCRKDDFSSASWRNVSGIDLVYEAMPETVYIMPGFKWGTHNSESGDNNIYAAGIKIQFNTGRVRVNISYLYDLNLNIRDGLLMFSATAGYL